MSGKIAINDCDVYSITFNISSRVVLLIRSKPFTLRPFNKIHTILEYFMLSALVLVYDLSKKGRKE